MGSKLTRWKNKVRLRTKCVASLGSDYLQGLFSETAVLR